MTVLSSLVFGVAAGVGCVLLVLAAVRPAPLDVAAAWHHLTSRDRGEQPRWGWRGRVDRALASLIRHAGGWRHPWLGLPRQDLAILHHSLTGYLQRRLAWALGAACAAGLALATSVYAGLTVPLAIVVLAVVAAAAAGAMVPVMAVRQAAVTARDEWRRTLAAYLDLVAQERATGRAPTQALRDAAAVGTNPVFHRLQLTLAHAHRVGVTPWHALGELGEQLGVVELSDAAALAATAADGAAVYTSLTTKAASLRTAAVTADKAHAHARSERLSLPVSLLLIGFLLLAVYPTLARLMAL